MLRQGNIVLLADELWKIFSTDMPKLLSTGEVHFVQRAKHFFRRFREHVYSRIFPSLKHMGCMRQRFRIRIAVIVGYRSDPFKKDIIHLRKTKGKFTTSLIFASYHIRYDSVN
ncbi:hypothetical protein ElyMa_002632300 [Elysia marginata]|uniref:Uncharacterized protein n=1 Tax=Elysia marginata TaxID=1093978 RepID=A0AAV4H5R8_9GAST|nr:hypothetical protein ElyMa_002632300 [Elysia marginata]